MATQEQRKAETRRRLLEAAAELFAAHGIEAVALDAVAEAADRTSGALYAHFGGKEGVLTALLSEWTNATAAVVAAEFETATSVEGRLDALWRALTDPPTDEARRWVLLEHELWLHAARHAATRDRLAARYRWVREQMATAVTAWREERGVDAPVDDAAVPALLLGLLLGLEMQHRLDPDAVPDDVAVGGLRALLGDLREEA